MTTRDESMNSIRAKMREALAHGDYSPIEISEIADLAVKAYEEADDAINRVVGAASDQRIELQALIYAHLIARMCADSKLSATRAILAE